MSLGLFKLDKLTIEGYSDEARKALIDRLTVQYNPETLSVRHESVFKKQPVVGGTGDDEGQWSHGLPGRLSVNLVVDGTRVGSLGAELLRHVPTVTEQIDRFLNTCYWAQSATHEPSYLKLLWGRGPLADGFNCRLESVDIQYTAFDRDGSPLHAELAAVFVEQLVAPLAAAERAFSSPDLSHRRVVVAGDTLPLLCRQIYGSPGHYLRVAQVNGLDDFRSLEPGQELLFPPFERPGRS